MIRTSIRRPIAVSMIYLAITALGVASFRNMPIELLPDTDLPRLSVGASWPGSSPEVVEAFLTAPLEAAIQQVRGVETITSVSSENAASITANFERDTDMEFARMELSERLAALEEDLPLGASPPRVTMYVPQDFQESQAPVLTYTVTGPYMLEYLREYVEDEIAPELYQLEGVGDIVVNGGRARVLEIELDQQKIDALGLRLDQVGSSIARMDVVREAGIVDMPDGLQRTIAIRHRTETADEIRALPLLVDRGRLVRVGDVARVFDTYEEPSSHYRVDGNPAVGINIRKELRTNTVAMADRVKAHLEAREGSLPTGMRIILGRDQSTSVRKQLSDLRDRAILSGIIVLFVLLIFLRSSRAAVVVFATVAFAMLITINILYFSGFTLNLLTLMGLAMGFGLVIDNAIVVLENIYRRRRLGEDSTTAAEIGTREVVLPILAGTFTTVVVLIPFVYLQGELRVFYVPLAIVVGMSQFAALFTSFTFTPALGARLLGAMPAWHGAAPVRAGTLPPMPPLSFSTRVYGGLIRWTMGHPWITVLLTLLMFGGSYYLFRENVTRGRVWGGGFGAGSSYLSINMSLPRGEELERVNDLSRFFEDRLKEMPEVERFITNVYPERATTLVYFPAALENTGVPEAIKEELFQYSLEWGGAEVRVIGYGPSFYGGGGSPPNYNIKILGYNYERTREIAEDLGKRLSTFSRVRGIDTNSTGSYQEDKATELVLDVDRTRLAMHELSAADLVARVNAAVQGRTGGQTVKLDGEEMQLSVKFRGYDTMDMHQLTELMIATPSGSTVRLGDVATIRERHVMNVIRRENQQYQRVVSYEFRGPQKLGDRQRDGVVKATLLPPGYTIEGQQMWSWSAEDQAQIYGIMIVSIILIFMVTAAVFESLKLPLCVLLTVPMALIGVFLVFFYTGATFTREAYVGVIMMGGVVVNNAILLVDHINQLRRKYSLALNDAVFRGTVERVRPILMTSFTTILGLLPLVLFSQTADQNIWNALGYALIGGLSSSTILVMAVTPALYMIFERRAEAKKVAGATAAEAVAVPA
jgi:HAE1 family hydrophobic/amphiphilic exporter-1